MPNSKKVELQYVCAKSMQYTDFCSMRNGENAVWYCEMQYTWYLSQNEIIKNHLIHTSGRKIATFSSGGPPNFDPIDFKIGRN